jgi:DNA mismatch endonuclease (patch repair protein)
MDKISRKKRSWNMSRIKSADTKPELFVRKYLSGKGLRFRINYKIPGKPDVAFPKHKGAIFIHGCFWHKHNCKYSVIPKSNRPFWLKKLNDNAKRDIRNLNTLKAKGWKILTIWECAIENKPSSVCRKVDSFINKYMVKPE